MLYLARKLTNNQETLKTIYYSLVQPYFDYCDVVWGDCSKTRADKLQKLQNRAAWIITRADYSIRSSDVLNSLEWSNLEERRKRHLLVKMFKVSIIISYRGAMAWNQLSNQTREIGDLIFYFLLFQIITISTVMISLAYYTN